MPEPNRKPEVVPFPPVQTCFNCSALTYSRTLMLAEIRRLEGELERAMARLRGDSHLHDVYATHGSAHRRDDGAKSLSYLQNNPGPKIPELRRRKP